MIRTPYQRCRALAHLLLAAALLLCAALYLAPPDAVDFWPACPIHQLLGLECPGCGATRALAALLHGHLQQAWQLNALFVLLLPFALAGTASSYRRILRAEPFCWPRLPGPALYSVLGVTLAFTIARNIIR